MKALFAKPVTVPKTSTTSPSAQKIVNTQKLGPTATLGASVMNSIASIDIRELSSATAVAQMYGISNADMKASMESANINVAKALGSIGGDSTKSALTQPLVTNMAAMANTISTLAKSEQREQFLVTAMAVVGKESIAEAAGDPVQAGVLTATIVSHAFGEPVSRDQIAGVFPALAQALYNQEKKVVTDGVFQKMYGHLPKTADDWKVVKQLAYGVNIADRDTGKSSEAKERYEKVNGVSLEALKNSTSVDDRNRYEAAIKTIDVVSANAIPLPPVSVKTPLTNQTSFGQKIKALFKASTYGFGR